MIPTWLNLDAGAPQVCAVLLALAALLGLAARSRPTARRVFLAILVFQFGIYGLARQLDHNNVDRKPGSLPKGPGGSDESAFFPIVSRSGELEPSLPQVDLKAALIGNLPAGTIPQAPQVPTWRSTDSSVVASSPPPSAWGRGVEGESLVATTAPPPPRLGEAIIQVTAAPAPVPLTRGSDVFALNLPRPDPTRFDPAVVVATANPGRSSDADGTRSSTGTITIQAPTTPRRTGDPGLALASLPGPNIKVLGVATAADLRVVSTIWQPIRLAGLRVVFVIDRSGSMAKNHRLVRVVAEAMKILAGLPDDAMFQMVFYEGKNPRDPVEFRDRHHTWLGDKTKLNWIRKSPETMKVVAKETSDGNLIPSGNTDPLPALRRAFGLNPSDIFFLSDGDFVISPKERDALKNENKSQAHIHGALIGETDTAPPDNQLDPICKDHHGTFKYHKD